MITASVRWLALLLFLPSSICAHAELPVARLTSIYPPGGKAGGTVEVTVAGLDLDDARLILFSNPNLTAKSKPGVHPGELEPNRFLITIGEAVRSGTYEARIVGRFGVTNPRLFAVSELPEMTCAAPTNHSPATATCLPVGSVVNGRAEAARIASFKFSARKGERVLVECTTQELDSKMEPTLILHDAEGRELEVSRGHGLLDFTAAADGEFWLKVHDTQFRGGDDYFYRLQISTGPHLDYVMPAAGQAGTTGRFALYGRNLPNGVFVPDLRVEGKPLQRLDVEIELPGVGDAGFATGMALKPASSVLEGFQYRFHGPNGVSNPVLISLASDQVVAEREPNDSPAQAQKLALPAELDGQFYPNRDRDWITFDAQKGQVSWIEIFSQRLGLPSSPFLLVQRVTEQGALSDAQEIYATEANPGGVECNIGTRDLAWRFEPKQSGEQKVQVRDLFNSLPPDPRRVYRLAIRRETPDFTLLAMPQPPAGPEKDRREAHTWSTFLRAGETLPIKVVALRRDGFDGEIRVGAEGLPSGVTSSLGVVEPGQAAGSLLLTASEGMAEWVGPIRIVGEAKVSGAEVKRVARNVAVVWDVGDYNLEAVRSELVESFYLAVTGQEKAPATLQVSDTNAFEVLPGAKLQIPCTLASHSEIGTTIKLRATGVPALDNMKEIELNAKTNQATLELDLAQQKIPVGTHHLYLVGQVQAKYQRPASTPSKAAAAKPQIEDRFVTLYSNPFTITVTSAPVSTAATAK